MPYQPRSNAQPLGIALAVLLVVIALLGSLLSVVTGPLGDRGVTSGASGDSVRNEQTPRVATADNQPVLARPSDGGTFVGRNLKWGEDAGPKRKTCHTTRPICARTRSTRT